MSRTKTPRPKLRTKKAHADVQAAFEASCAAQLQAPGLVLEALMIQYIRMNDTDRLELAVLRDKYRRKTKIKPR